MKKLSLFLLAAFCCLLSFAQSTQRIYLSGTGSDDALPWDFFCTGGMNAGKWTKIPVPSCWELQGFGKYDYGFAKDSVKGREQGLYKRRFFVPAGWKKNFIRLRFEGVMTDAEVKINGKPMDFIHRGAFYSFAYDINEYLRYNDSNLLEVTVSKHSSDPSVNDAEREGDFWIFGGIFRPVFLEVLPRDFIDFVSIDAKAGGELVSAVFVNGVATSLSVELLDEKNRSLGRAESRLSTTNISTTKFSARFPGVRNWTPETPTRYRAVYRLWKGKDLLHQYERKIGFRTVELRQRDGIYVNGVRIKIKGVNRHPFWPTTGRTTSRALSIEDVQLMKEMNMNAVRTAHYPPDEHFLNVCDSLGVFVMDELAGWHGRYATETGTRLLNEMVLHDQHHPSIIFWANGNEGGHNPAFDSLFAQFDIQERPVVHPWELFNGIETQHYREYNYGIGNYDRGREIVMPTEFLHGQFDGGHGAGLEDYWEQMWRNPLSAGGFLWVFADEGVVRKDLHDSLDTDKHRGADGILGPYHEKEASFYAIREIWSPVQLLRRELTPTFDGRLELENRYLYSNLDQCRLKWRWGSLRNRRAPGWEGSIALPSAAPGTRVNVILPLPKNWKDYDVLYLTVLDAGSKELFTWSLPVTRPEMYAQAVQKAGTGRAAYRLLQDSVIEVSAEQVTLRFHKNTGRLLSVAASGKNIPFNNGPIVQEGANNFAPLQARYEGDTLILASAFDRKLHYNTILWKVYPSGVVKLEVRYFPGAYATWFAGINFDFPESQIRGIDFVGFGPYRVWKNRLRGNRFGYFQKNYNGTETGEQWVYPEFKGYYQNLYACTFRTSGQPFTVLTENEDLFLRLFRPAWKTDQWHNYEPLFPSGDLSFMQGIPSIGSKTQRAETTGPMGMKNLFYDYEKEPARALSIVLYFDFRSPETIIY